ncbi:hypothetical protein CPT_Stills58 [Bacillus phage Stills]|uniref:Uncharacterized protein n=1 Tax=Bacillus phage Stills TaxID=1610833 RepID=A0A0E3T5K7_9CAUD|nr:hypothetical protein CPT_Stills58 [Bacillus phage Stills]AKC02686.1 hypothetical protein CPT_Stills58 [Bacillus phage Stills]
MLGYNKLKEVCYEHLVKAAKQIESFLLEKSVEIKIQKNSDEITFIQIQIKGRLLCPPFFILL